MKRALGLLVLAILVVGCGKSNPTTGPATTPPNAKPGAVPPPPPAPPPPKG